MDERAPAVPPDEPLYQQTLEQLRSPPRPGVTSLLFTVLLLVFVLGAFMDLRSVTGVVLLIGAIVIHEAGHALGMRAFGFRDVQMFFVPFFGAAVSGRERGAAAWKEAAVSLLGPVPGILLGFVLLFLVGARLIPTRIGFQLIGALLWLNAFNLLPLGFLDGGRFFERVLFSRHRLLEIGFQVIGSLALIGIAVFTRWWVLGVVVGFSLLGIPVRWRVLREAAGLRRRLPSIHPDPDRLTDADARLVFAAAREALGSPLDQKAATVARTMENVLSATKRPPGFLASLGLIVAYVAGVGCALVGLVWLETLRPPAPPVPRMDHGWRAEFPVPPERSDRAGRTHFQAVVDEVEIFTVDSLAGPGGSDWDRAAALRMEQEGRWSQLLTRPVDISRHAGLEVVFLGSERTMRARFVACRNNRYTVTASAPRWGERQRRFLESFALNDSITGL